MKKVISTLLAIFMLISLVGCSNDNENNGKVENSSSATVRDDTNTTQVPASQDLNIAEPSNQSITTSPAVDPASYWQGDDYFDMIGYLEACGCKVMYTAVIDGDFHTSDAYSNDTVAYSVFFEESALHPNDSSASLGLYFTSSKYGGNTLAVDGNSLAISYYDNNDAYHRDFTPLLIIENQKDVIVDQYNNTLDIHTITQIEMLINKLYVTNFHGETAEDMKTFFDDYNQY